MQSFGCEFSYWRKATKCCNDLDISTIHNASIHTHVGRSGKMKGRTDSQLALNFENEWLYCGLVLGPAAAAVKLLNSLGPA